MGRMPKWRRVTSIPEVTYFKPAGIPYRTREEVSLSVEEVEAIRLKDLEGLEQADCAQKMNVSRPTFHRVLAAARRKLADALLNGKAIRIEGGNFELASRQFYCINGHRWEVPFKEMIAGPPPSCPTCDSPDIMPVQTAGFGWARKGCGRNQGRGRA